MASFASIATGVYVPPGATGTPKATSTASPLTWTSGDDKDPGKLDKFLYYFIKPYIDAHSLSRPSWRYAYILWILIGFLAVSITLFHHFFSGNGGFLSAFFRKYTVKRIAFRSRASKAHELEIQQSLGKRTMDDLKKSSRRMARKWAMPTVNQILIIFALIIVSFCLVFVGPDYLAPTECTWGGTCRAAVNQGPPRSTYMAKRGFIPGMGEAGDHAPFLGRDVRVEERDVRVNMPPLPRGSEDTTRFIRASRASSISVEKRATAHNNNPNGYVWFTDPLLSGPNFQVWKSWWTSSARFGLITYALLPLIVTLALKYWPFNIFATPFLTDYGYDKTAMLHRWIARIGWVLSTLHVATWSVQLAMDKDPYGRSLGNFKDVWMYWRFRMGVAAYVFLTIIIVHSLNPVRNKHYEFFWYSHVLFSILFIVFCLLHYQNLQAWCIGALAVWGLERIWRIFVFFWINGFRSSDLADSFRPNRAQSGVKVANVEKRSNGLYGQPSEQSQTDKDWRGAARGTSDGQDYDSYPALRYGEPGAAAIGAAGAAEYHRGQRALNSLFAYGPGQAEGIVAQHNTPGSPSHLMYNHDRGSTTGSLMTDKLPYKPRQQRAPVYIPPGFALAQLLPGRTIRLTVQTPRTIRWRPGQHVQLTLPNVKFWQSHPYTLCNMDERQLFDSKKSLAKPEAGSKLVLIIRARQGFTKNLWDFVAKKRRAAESDANEATAKGVYLRAMVGLPIGSAGRTKWGDYSTLVIMCGGTGISFGMALLEWAVSRMAQGGDPGQGGIFGGKGRPWKTTRIRFVWVMREYAHIAWIAPALRRCIEMVSPHQLRVELYVTGELGQQTVKMAPASYWASRTGDEGDSLAPPTAPFAADGRRDSHQSLTSMMSEDEGEPTPARPARPPRNPARTRDLEASSNPQVPEEEEVHGWDDVVFDGEPEENSPGDDEVSRQIKKEGKVRRAASRRHASGRGRRGAPRSRDDKPTHQYPPAASPNLAGPSLSPSANSSSYDLSNSPIPPQPRSPGFHQSQSSSRVNTPNLQERDSFMDPDNASTHGLVQSARMRDEAEDVWLDIDDDDQADLKLVAELAKTGKPRIAQILDEEIEASKGATMVACCGPTSLNTMMRTLVGDRIDPMRVAKGDPRGMVNLCCEDFTF